MGGRQGFALKRVRLLEASFSSPRQFPGSANRRFGISDATIETEIDAAARTCLVRVGVEVTAHANDLAAFTLRATMEGLFEGEQEGLPLDLFASVNAPAILFPYLRETVSNLTARSGHPALLLPTVNFVELVRIYAAGGRPLQDESTEDNGPPPEAPGAAGRGSRTSRSGS